MPVVIYQVTEDLNIDYIYNRVLDNGIPITGIAFSPPYIHIYLEREITEEENTFIAESISRSSDPQYSSIPDPVYKVDSIDDYGRLAERSYYENFQDGSFSGKAIEEKYDWENFKLIRKTTKYMFRDGTVYKTEVNDYFTQDGNLVTKLK